MTRYTLSELCAIIGEALDNSLAPTYWVQAEISSLSEKGGHMYLELVEGKNAKMRATCWAGTKELLTAYFESETGQRLQAGMAVKGLRLRNLRGRVLRDPIECRATSSRLPCFTSRFCRKIQ